MAQKAGKEEAKGNLMQTKIIDYMLTCLSRQKEKIVRAVKG